MWATTRYICGRLTILFSTVDPKIRTPYIENWTFGFERKIAGNWALDVNYVGNHAVHMWEAYDLVQHGRPKDSDAVYRELDIRIREKDSRKLGARRELCGQPRGTYVGGLRSCSARSTQRFGRRISRTGHSDSRER